MLKNLFRKTWIKVLLAGIIIVTIIATVLIKTKAEPIVHDRLAKWLETSPFAKGTVSFEGPDIDLVTRSIRIYNIQIEKDTLNQFDGTIGEIKVSGISVSSLLWGDTLLIGKVSIVHPDIHVGEKITQKKKSSSSSNKSQPSPVRIKTIRVEAGKLTVDQPPMSISTSIDLTMSNNQYRGPAQEDTLASFYFEKLEFNTPDFYWKSNNMNVKGPLRISGSEASIDPADTVGSLPITLGKMQVFSDSLVSTTSDSSYAVVFRDMTFTKSSHDLLIREVRISSPDEPLELGRRLGHEIDWMDMKKLKLHITGLDYSHYMKKKELLIRHILLDSADMTVFRDKRLPLPDKPPTVMPYVFLQRLPTPFRVDSLTVSNANITYKEFVADGDAAGHITFAHINAGIGNFTNMDSLSSNATVNMHASCLLMGKGRLSADFLFPLNKNSGLHYASGHLDPLDMDLVNPMISEVGFMRIKEGKLMSMDFKFAYNALHSNGDLTMFYDNLKVETIDKQTNSTKGTGEAIKSFLANSILIQNKNIKDDKYRRGVIDFDRDNKKSILNYWWKSVLSGIKSTMMATKDSDKIKKD